MNSTQNILNEIAEKLIGGDAEGVVTLTKNALSQNIEAKDVDVNWIYYYGKRRGPVLSSR